MITESEIQLSHCIVVLYPPLVILHTPQLIIIIYAPSFCLHVFNYYKNNNYLTTAFINKNIND